MATTVTLTITDADAPRVIAALRAPSQLSPGPNAPLFPTPVGASNAATIKTYLTNVVQQMVAAFEAGAAEGVASAPLVSIS